MISSLTQLNAATDEEAREALITCCGSHRWASEIARQRPFEDVASLLSAAHAISNELVDEDWLEAVASHPRIGERSGGGDTRHAGWSAQEQAGAVSAQVGLLDEMRVHNLAYEERFGYTFIVCATGKSAEEMLRACRERLLHDPANELQFASEELKKIAEIRLRKLIGGIA
jgi:OHCU decarboxylase